MILWHAVIPVARKARQRMGALARQLWVSASAKTFAAYDFGSKLSITLSMLKLAGLARGGNSLKDSNH